MRQEAKEKLLALMQGPSAQLAEEFLEICIEELYKVIMERPYSRLSKEKRQRNLRVRKALLGYRGGYLIANWFRPNRYAKSLASVNLEPEDK